MKKIRSSVIILLIVAVVLIGIGFASGASWESLFNGVTTNGDFIEQDPIVYSDQITMLDIDVETRSVVIESTSESEITINHYRVEDDIWHIDLTDNTLTITQEDEPGISGWFNWRLPTGDRDDIIITIPETYMFEITVIANTGSIHLSAFDALEDVYLETDTGSIYVDDIHATQMDVSSDTGSITINDVVSDDTIIETNTGSATITHLTTQNVSVDINTGSITLTTIIANQVDLTTNTGSIRVSDIDLDERSVHLQTDTGSVYVNQSSQGRTYQVTHSNMSFYLNAETNTGSIYINES